MIGKYVKGNVAVFIDASNVLYVQKTLGWRLDYQRFVEYLHKECQVSGFYYYTGKIASSGKQNGFLAKLLEYGYKVISKEVKFIKLADGTMLPKGNLDIELALDAYRLSDSYETLILCSGDSDFAYLLDLLKERGKRVLVMSTRGHISKELLERAKYIDFHKLRGEISR